MSTLLQIGDVVKAPQGWAFAVGRSGPIRPLQVSDDATEEWIVRDVSGNPLSEYNHHDPTRVGSLFVVEEARLAGGGTPGDYDWDFQSHGWQVIACRLAPDGSYDPEGERIEFYQSDGFLYRSSPEVVGKMRRTFVPVE